MITLTTWQGCSDPKTDPYTIKQPSEKRNNGQVVVYKKQRLMTPPPPPSPTTNLQSNKLFCVLRYLNQIRRDYRMDQGWCNKVKIMTIFNDVTTS